MVQKLISLAMTLLMTFICCVILMEFAVLLNTKITISQTARKYMLKMEADGHLTQENRSRLVAELNQQGVTGVSFEGTSLSDVGYGNDVILQFAGNLHYKVIKLLTLLQAHQENAVEPIRERVVSTAKN